MKKTLTFAVLLAFAPEVFATLAEARTAFERVQIEPFARSVLVDWTAAPVASRYDKAAGKASFAFALPYCQDTRLKFVTAQFEGGKLVSAKLHVLGFDPKPLDATAFEQLRDAFPMVSVRTDSEDVNPVSVLYPARNRSETIRVTDDLNLVVNPVGYRLWTLNGSISRIGASLAKLAYKVTLTGKDGYAVDLGVATVKEPLSQKQVMTSIRVALERRDPTRKGTFSDRDVIDFRHAGTLSFTAL